MATYQDNAQVCHACLVAGCETCAGEAGGCQACLIFHVRSSASPEGQCLFLYGALFAAAALFGICFLLLALLRFCCLGLAAARAPGVLKEGLAHRRRAKVHDYSLPGNPFYLYDDTNLRRQSISGVAPVLYFNFVAFLILLSFLSLLLLLVGVALPEFSRGEDGLVPLPQALPKKDLGMAKMVHAVALYAVCFLAVANWMYNQDWRVKVDTEEEPHLRNYALVAEGFPKSARSPHEVKAFFESILGFEVEGVSIAYDHIEELAFVEDRIARAVEKADTHLGVYPSELSGLEGHVGDSQDGYVLDCLMCSGFAFVIFSREEDREFCMRRFAEIDRQIRQGSGGSVEEPGSDSENEEAQSLLLKTAPGRPRVARSGGGPGGPSRAVLFRGKFPIRVGHAPEPCGIQWHNFVVRRGMKVVRVAVTLLGALLFVLVIGAVMFAPAVLYELRQSREALGGAVLARADGEGSCGRERRDGQPLAYPYAPPGRRRLGILAEGQRGLGLRHLRLLHLRLELRRAIGHRSCGGRCRSRHGQRPARGELALPGPLDVHGGDRVVRLLRALVEILERLFLGSSE